MAIRLGTRIGVYKIGAKIGVGGMGEVYRAYDTRLKRSVAIKVLPDAVAADAERLARFQQEAEVLARLNHPNIAVIHGLEDVVHSPSEPGTQALVMELVDGPTLADRIAQAAVGIDEALRIASQVAQALEASHEQDIVHRDLKPANIKLRPDGVVKVLDFGLARVVSKAGDGQASQAPTAWVNATRAGVVVGTASYMSPEQARGLAVDTATDVWAFGCILYEMLAQQLAFAGETFTDTMARVIEREPDWTALPSTTPPEVQRLLRHSLAKDSRQRLRDIRDARLQIDEVIAARRAPASSRPPAPGMTRGWPSLVTIAGIGAGALIVLAGIALWRSSQDRPAIVVTTANTVERRVSTGAPASGIPEANEAFELAMQFQGVQNNVPRAQEVLARALALDPRFAEALRYHAVNYAILLLNGYTNDTSQLYRAEEELREAARLAPDLPGLPSAWATVYLTQGRKELVPWEQLDRALREDPSHVNNRFWRGVALLLSGDSAAAKAEFRTILANRPLFGPARVFLGETLRAEGDVQGAIRELEKVLEQAPDNISAIQGLSLTYLDDRDPKRARMLLDSKRSIFSRNHLWRALSALVLAAQSNRTEALQAMDEGTLKFAGAAFPSTLVVTEFYALVGDRSKAFEWLERTVRNGDERTDLFRSSPRLSGIREDPRFTRIIETVESRKKQRIRAQ